MHIIRAAKLNGDVFNIKVDSDNYRLIRLALNEEKIKIIDKLKSYKTAGLIGSIFYPRNRYIQRELDELVYKKKVLKRSIEQINKIFK